ncbi:MAG TPA: hypothetical protein VFA84_07010 [Acidimicrobiales bacterium]|nr:hypothetical protein [Acidimicrobiales bacterium]
MTTADLVAVARAHAEAEAVDDLATVLATLEDDPVYELQPVGLVLNGMDLAKRYYDHFFTTFRPVVANYAMRGEWVNDVGLLQEYTIWTSTGPGGAIERHEVIGLLTFGRTKLSGERVYGSERLLRLMFGPVYDDGVAVDPTANMPQP